MGKSYIYIYIAKGTPVILNVDNEADGEALEKLGAIKMPEHMAAEIFGNNIRYADNTTCVITENQDNPAFPYNVNFDASKITAKPKRDTGTLAGIGMPSGRLINIGAQGSGYVYTAPYSGFICFRASSQQTNGWIALNSGDIASELIGNNALGLSIFLPVLKGKKVVISHDGVKITDLFFVKAVGE